MDKGLNILYLLSILINVIYSLYSHFVCNWCRPFRIKTYHAFISYVKVASTL